MSSKKTRKEKIKYQKALKEREKELKKLRQEALELEYNIKYQKKANIKNFHIKNLKIFGSVCNFVAPFAYVSILTVGTVCLCKGGLPIVIDDITKCKRYSLVYQTDELVDIKEQYETNYFSNNLSNELKIYSPWKKTDDDNYSRVIQTYELEELSDDSLYNAVLQQDISYIEENFTDFKEETEITNMKQEISNQYIIEANLNFFDTSDTLIMEESDLKNMLVSFGELVFSLGLGALFAALRKFKLKSSITLIKKEYKIISTKPLEDDLQKTQDKILALTKGGKNNVK